MNTLTLNIHEDLIAKCREGDARAQHDLYRLYAKAMFNSALRICGEREDAEDVLQEAFISAFRNIKSYRADASFGAWLKRIVINKALNMVKSRGRDALMITEVENDATLVANEGNGVELSVERVKAAVEDLAPGFRAVISLYLFEGYDHQEIGEILKISESTSKTQYKRAKDKLRMKLEEMRKYG